MSRFSYVAGAVLAVAFSCPSFANDAAQSTGGSAANAKQSPSAAAAAQCNSMTGAQREQCERDARQRSGSGSTAGATSGGAAGAVGGASAQQTPATPGGAGTSSAKP